MQHTNFTTRNFLRQAGLSTRSCYLPVTKEFHPALVKPTLMHHSLTRHRIALIVNEASKCNINMKHLHLNVHVQACIFLMLTKAASSPILQTARSANCKYTLQKIRMKQLCETLLICRILSTIVQIWRLIPFGRPALNLNSLSLFWNHGAELLGIALAASLDCPGLLDPTRVARRDPIITIHCRWLSTAQIQQNQNNNRANRKHTK